MADSPESFERDILRERTRAAAATDVARRHATATAIDFTVAGERHAIQFDVLQAVVPVGELTPVPRAPPEVAGLMLVEGAVVPVFELAVVLALPWSGSAESSFVLLLGHDHAEVGLRVDAAGELLRLDAERPFAPTGPTPIRSEWIRGLGPDGVPVVDGEGLLASERLYVDVALSERPEPVHPPETS